MSSATSTDAGDAKEPVVKRPRGTVTGEAPGDQGARRANIGNIQATSNAERRDASPVECSGRFTTGSGVAAPPPAASAPAAPVQEAQPWQFFVVASLAAATLAVVLAVKTAPEHLVMLSLTVFAAGATALAGYHVIAPLVAERRRRRVITSACRAALLAEKALALRTIKELEFDRAMGKMSQADFEEMAARLKARALRVMQQLDAEATR